VSSATALGCRRTDSVCRKLIALTVLMALRQSAHTCPCVGWSLMQEESWSRDDMAADKFVGRRSGVVFSR
jgi:hypothetical protein